MEIRSVNKKTGTFLNVKGIPLVQKGVSPYFKTGVSPNLNRGAVTVEASIVLPVFICVIVSIVFLIRIVHTHKVIQHAISSAALEMAATGYIYHISGLQGIHDDVRDELDSKSELFKNHLSSVADAYEALNSFSDVYQGENGGIDNIVDYIENTEQTLEELLEGASGVIKNPVDEFKSIVFFAVRGAFEDIKTELFIPIVKLYIKKYLACDGIDGIDNRLTGLNIKGGFSGLDFHDSNFFADENNDIDIVVKYEMKLPVPIKIFPQLIIIQRSAAKAWLGGSTRAGGLGSNKEDDIWSLDNFRRGRKIRAIFEANMPDTFPVIASFRSGTAEMIKSMDTTSKTYQSGDNVEKILKEYIDKLSVYWGQEEPWGKPGIVINRNEIKARQLLLVIPLNPVNEEIQSAIERCKTYSRAKGVVLNVERYGRKKVNEDIKEYDEDD